MCPRLVQAQKAIEQGRQSSEKLEISHGRLELISVELDKQAQVQRKSPLLLLIGLLLELTHMTLSLFNALTCHHQTNQPSTNRNKVVRQLTGQLRLRINGMQRTLQSYKSRSNEVLCVVCRVVLCFVLCVVCCVLCCDVL